MGVTALALSLSAAFVHAAWNLLIARDEDSHSVMSVAVLFGLAMLAPVAALTWRMDVEAVPYVVLSGALTLTYLMLLSTAYQVAEVSFVYPIARGSGPVFVVIIGLIALGVTLSAGVIAGVVLVSSGVVLVRGITGPASGIRDLLLALSIGAAVAVTTLVDAQGLKHAGPLSYVACATTIVGTSYFLFVLRIRGYQALRAAVRPVTVLAGLGFISSYALILAAITLAPAAAVASVRECSVLIATLFAAYKLRERVPPARMAGVVLVVVGIALVTLG